MNAAALRKFGIRFAMGWLLIVGVVVAAATALVVMTLPSQIWALLEHGELWFPRAAKEPPFTVGVLTVVWELSIIIGVIVASTMWEKS